MRIIIAGSRDFTNYNFLKEKCEEIINNLQPQSIEIISGGARGTDRLGEVFASEKRYNLKEFPANWDTYGKSAGYRRNVEMANYAKENDGMLIAFSKNNSKGTNHMIDIAKKYGLKVYVYEV